MTTQGGVTIWCESIARDGSGRVLSTVPVWVADSGPADYAARLCQRLSEIAGTDWRVCDPQPKGRESGSC
jgi:hypothetical protein